jgi:hypothetical protein
MSRLWKTLLICLAASLLTAVPASAAPTASAAAKCSVRGQEQRLGAATLTYVKALSTRRVSCADARSFSRLYHRCRRSDGDRGGSCPRVRRFRCSEDRYNYARVRGRVLSYDSKVLCTRGRQRIRQTYTQVMS